jgi:hypothetical protein
VTSEELTEDGFLTVSASQIGTAALCLRRWGFDKLDRVAYVPHRSARAGQRIHKILEDWLGKALPPNTEEVLVIDGTEYMPGKSVFNGMHNLPPPGPHMKLELPIRILPTAPEHLAHRWFWFGFIDWAYTTLENGMKIPVFGDHKSSGDPKKWGLNDETIRTDPQAIIYSNAVLRVFKDAPYTRAAWNYFGSRKPYPSRRVVATFTREEVEVAMQPFDMLASALVQLRRTKGLRAMDLPPNPLSCGAYGGCPHRNVRCPLTDDQRAMEYTMSEMSLDERMAMTTNGAGTILATPPPLPAAAWPPDGWQLHTDPNAAAAGWYWKQGEPAAVHESELRARYAPPIIVPAVQTAPPIPSAPPVPAAQNLPPIVALPVGMINAPEGQNLQQRAMPVVEVQGTPAAQTGGIEDDLSAITDRPTLVKICDSLGLVHKSIQVKGLRDMIRTARANGAQVTIPTAAPKQGELPEIAPLDASAMTKDRIVLVLCALITAREGLDDTELVNRSKSIVALVERL